MNLSIESDHDRATVARVVQHWFNQYDPEVWAEVMEGLLTLDVKNLGTLVLRLRYCVNHMSMWDHEETCETEVIRWFEDPYRDGEECDFVWVEGRVANA